MKTYNLRTLGFLVNSRTPRRITATLCSVTGRHYRKPANDTAVPGVA